MPLVQVVSVETDRSHDLTGHVVGDERHRQVFSAGLADCGLQPSARVLRLGRTTPLFPPHLRYRLHRDR